MADPSAGAASSRFTSSSKTTQERLSSNTVGLVALSDFRKRRAEALEQQQREARDALASDSTPDRSQTATPNLGTSEGSEAENVATRFKKKQRRNKAKTGSKLSFRDDDDEEGAGGGEGDDSDAGGMVLKRPKEKSSTGREGSASSDGTAKEHRNGTGKIAANASVGVAPRALTKAALRREAAEREALRREFLVLQAAVKAAEIAIPFVFYDGTNIPGGTVRVRKGDFIWVFLDKSRKVGAELGVGGDKTANSRREWARVGVDDLMLVRGTMIIPHHYEFYFFIMNKTVGPGDRHLFNYSAEAPPARATSNEAYNDSALANPLSRSLAARSRDVPHITSLEGASDDPAFTKVVDRRWYERNKHIYPASVWQEFDPEKSYQNEIQRDPGGNTFFYSK